MPLKILHGGGLIDPLLDRLLADKTVNVESLGGRAAEFSPSAVHQVSV